MERIAEWAGRFKQIARKKQKSKHDESIECSGVTLGNKIERILPNEQKGKEQLGKGPIVLCLDQSGRMSQLDIQSKGFTLALMSIARRQRRDFALILYQIRLKHIYMKEGKSQQTKFDYLK